MSGADAEQGRNRGAKSCAMTLRVVTPQGVALETACDSVTLPLADGGSVGVHRGHLGAEMALSKGMVVALAGGVCAGRASIESGFAMVEKDTVTVIADDAQTDAPSPEAGEGAAR